MSITDYIQLVTIVISLGGLIFAIFSFVRQLKETKEQIALNFFADYTKRYQEIMLNLPFEINNKEFDFKKLKAKKKAHILKYMRAYFDLCSEEYYLHIKNKLPDEVWKEWDEGIRYSFSKNAFQQGWKIINLDSSFYSEFTKWVKCELLK